jgi:hypothetical protein
MAGIEGMEGLELIGAAAAAQQPAPLMEDSDSSDDEFDLASVGVVVQNNRAAMAELVEGPRGGVVHDLAAADEAWLSPAVRSSRTLYFHAEALSCINRDYLGPTPIFNDRQFDMMFRISKSRFQTIMEDVGATQNPFYCNPADASGKIGASFGGIWIMPGTTCA